MTEQKGKAPAVKKSSVKKGGVRKKLKQRREFIRSAFLVAGVTFISLLGAVPVIKHWFKRLRPPGALVEDEFLAACIKCGQCVQVCPVKAIKLADIDEGFGVGVPYIDAREQACDFSCDGLQCVLACPTGALTHDLDYPADTLMGMARVDKPKLCLARQGEGFKGIARGADYKGLLRYEEIDRWNPIPVNEYPYDLEICDLCVRQCPIEIRINQCESGKPPSGDENQCPPKHAITMEEIESDDGIKRMTPVIHEGCVGCGVCEMICPVEPTVILVDKWMEGRNYESIS